MMRDISKNISHPAFPYSQKNCCCKKCMPLRIYFAAKAMQAFISNVDERMGGSGFVDIIGIANGAYKMADAMIDEQNK